MQNSILFFLMMGYGLMNGLATNNVGVDALGHLGGFISGILLAMFFFVLDDSSRIKMLKPIGIIVFLLFIAGLSLFLFLRKIPGCEDPLGYL